jgi:branched-chain amino acid transport system ATP-binding protein
MKEVLKGVNLTKSFGGVHAVNNVSLEFKENEVCSVVGPNGAGKTTIFNLISGVYSPDTGQVIFQSKDINHLRADKRCKLGLTRTFQITKPFLKLTVLENVMVGAYNHTNNREVSARQAREMLKATGLDHRANFLASTLTLEERKRFMEIVCDEAKGKILVSLKYGFFSKPLGKKVYKIPVNN